MTKKGPKNELLIKVLQVMNPQKRRIRLGIKKIIQ